MSETKPNQMPRQYRNLLVTGHRDNRLPVNKKLIFDALGSVMKAFNTVVEKDKQKLRILTSYATGTDTEAAKIAKTNKLEMQIIAPCVPQELKDVFPNIPRMELACSLVTDVPHHDELYEVFENVPKEQVVLVANLVTDEPQHEWVAVADETKLALADAVIVVWDGKKPNGTMGGSVRILIEAIQRMMPIIWIDASNEKVGKIYYFDLTQANPALLLLLQSGEQWIEHEKTHRHFKVVNSLEDEISKLTESIWGVENKLISNLNGWVIDPKCNQWCIKWVYDSFKFIFGKEKKKSQESPTAIKKEEFPEINIEEFVKKIKKVAWCTASKFVAKKEEKLPERNIEEFIVKLKKAAGCPSSIHRGQVILIHLFAGLAVFGAVAGAIDWLDWGEIIWGLFELLTLSAILVLIWHDKHSPIKAHKAWMSYRPISEMLRYNKLLKPMLATLPSLHRSIWSLNIESEQPKKPVLLRETAWLTTQLIRESGAPSGEKESPYVLSDPKTQSTLIAQLKGLIENQLDYHERAGMLNKSMADRLEKLIGIIFFIVFVVVCVHFLVSVVHESHSFPECVENAASWILHQRWLLLITATFPAFAAVFHGINSKLEIERMADNSELMHKKLSGLLEAVKELEQEMQSDVDGNREDASRAMQLRKLAVETVQKLYEENDAWERLLSSQELGVPT